MKKGIFIVLLSLIFFLGWASGDSYNYFANYTEMPYVGLFSLGSERPSPRDFVSNEQILIYKDRVVIMVPDATWARYADTNSMDPFLDKEATGLEVVPNCDEISVGDVIAYNSNWSNSVVVHRVIKINEDSKGIYFTLKGDNSPVVDPQRVRCDDVKYQLFGVIY